MEYRKCIPSPLGPLTLSSDGEALTGLWFADQLYFGSTLSSAAVPAEFPLFRKTERWLEQYFAGKCPDFCPPLAPQGTAFRKEVWELLLQIPYGETRTYGELARILADRHGLSRMSAQAVGGAVGHNPIGILIPCHRVVGTGGSLTGYAGGLEKKQQLLTLEGLDMSRFFLPH